MPELPEIETTKRGVSPRLLNQFISKTLVRQEKLRVPVNHNIDDLCKGKQIIDVTRRAKYLIIHLTEGYLFIHLGMSGHIRFVSPETPAGKHDHIDLVLENNMILRYNDPRRFGLWLYIKDSPSEHPLLSHLGPEPLTDEFNSDYLFKRAQNKTQPIKSFIMDNKIVVGVGNIYAAESLFLAGINPRSPAGSIPLKKIISLTNHIKDTLALAIKAGGTTLRDFYAADGKPGYFSNELKIYGRQNNPCYSCETIILSTTIGGRNSAFCPNCQPN